MNDLTYDDENYPEQELIAHTVRIMPVYIDRLAKRFGITQEDAANELLLALITCGAELDEAKKLDAEPLASVVQEFGTDEEDDITEEPGPCQNH